MRALPRRARKRARFPGCASSARIVSTTSSERSKWIASSGQATAQISSTRDRIAASSVGPEAPVRRHRGSRGQPKQFRDWAQVRGWNIPLYAAGNGSYILDYYFAREGASDPALVSMMNVFRKTPEGIFHTRLSRPQRELHGARSSSATLRKTAIRVTWTWCGRFGTCSTCRRTAEARFRSRSRTTSTPTSPSTFSAREAEEAARIERPIRDSRYRSTAITAPTRTTTGNKPKAS